MLCIFFLIKVKIESFQIKGVVRVYFTTEYFGLFWQVGIPYIGDNRRQRVGLKLLYEMNVAQLQVVVNDLHTQIESKYQICMMEFLIHEQG